MKKIMLLMFVTLCLNLNAKSLSSYPYSTDIRIEGEREKVVGTFLSKETEEERFEFIKDYMEKPEDYIQFLNTLKYQYARKKSKSDPESIINTSFIALKLSDKLNTSSWSKENIYDFVDLNYITDIKHLENFIKIFKNNKLLNTRMIFFNSSTRNYIKNLLEKNDTETIIKVMSLYNDSDYKLYIFNIIKQDIESKIYKVEHHSFNKKRFDYSDIIPPYDKTVYEVLNILKQNNIKTKNNESTNYLNLFANPDVFNLFSKDTQNMITNFYMFDKETLKVAKTRAEPHYNFKSLKGYLEFIAYSEYNFIFAILFLLYIFNDIKKMLNIKNYNKNKNKLINSTKDFFYKNKIEDNEVLPIKIIVDKFNVYNDAINQYDKLYIRTLKLGMFSKQNLDILNDIQKQIESSEKNILNIKKELLDLENKFNSKEMKELIIIRHKVENLFENTTFDFITTNIKTLIDKIENLLQSNITQNDINDIKKEIEEIEKKIKNSNEYLKEYNSFIYYNTPYEVLGVSENDSIDVIKKSWKTLCIKYHSDKNIDKPEYVKNIYEEIIKIINNAWDIISKKNKEN